MLGHLFLKLVSRSAALSALVCAYYAYQARKGKYDQPTDHR